MWIATIIDKGDFGREITSFVCDSESRAYTLAEKAVDSLPDTNEGWYGYSVDLRA